MKLAFSTNAFSKVSLSEAIKVIAEIGYQGVEIMADRPHLWPEDFSDEMILNVVEEARDLNIEFSNINGFMMKAIGDIHHPSWIETDPSDRRIRLSHTIECLKIAARLGAPSVSTEPGGPLVSDDLKLQRSIFGDLVRKAGKTAQDLDVRLLIEPEPELLLESMDDTVDFIKSLQLSAGLGINFDIGHFFCIGQDPAELIRKYPDCLEHIHIEDIAANRKHHHLIPGHGALDFKAIFAALFDVNYKGFITVELYPYEDEPEKAAEEAFRFLKPFIEG